MVIIGTKLNKKSYTKKGDKVNKVTKVLTVSLIVNSLLSVLKIIFGFLSNYASLIADGIHSFSDLITDVVSIIGNKLSLKPADSEHPFGHGIIEYITSLIISFTIIILGINLIVNVFDHEVSVPSLFIMFVSLFTILAKYILSSYIYEKGIKYKNNILIASAKESKSDVVSSIFVLISIILIQFKDVISILKYSDIVGTILISILIIRTGYMVLKDNLSKIIGEQITDNEYIEKLKEIILNQENILEIKNLYVLKNGPYYKLLSDIYMNGEITVKLAHDIIDEVEDDVKKFDKKIKYVFIHMEPK